MKTKIKNFLEVMLYAIAAIGLLDFAAQALTGGETRIVRPILEFLFR